MTKAVVVTEERYISSKLPHIRENEFRTLKTIHEYQVAEKLRKYIRTYLKAKQHPDIPRNQKLLECSTLQYFERYIIT